MVTQVSQVFKMVDFTEKRSCYKLLSNDGQNFCCCHLSACHQTLLTQRNYTQGYGTLLAQFTMIDHTVVHSLWLQVLVQTLP